MPGHARQSRAGSPLQSTVETKARINKVILLQSFQDIMDGLLTDSLLTCWLIKMMAMSFLFVNSWKASSTADKGVSRKYQEQKAYMLVKIAFNTIHTGPIAHQCCSTTTTYWRQRPRSFSFDGSQCGRYRREEDL